MQMILFNFWLKVQWTKLNKLSRAIEWCGH